MVFNRRAIPQPRVRVNIRRSKCCDTPFVPERSEVVCQVFGEEFFTGGE
jgi:hypothetical protein